LFPLAIKLQEAWHEVKQHAADRMSCLRWLALLYFTAAHVKMIAVRIGLDVEPNLYQTGVRVSDDVMARIVAAVELGRNGDRMAARLTLEAIWNEIGKDDGDAFHGACSHTSWRTSRTTIVQNFNGMKSPWWQSPR
jgi:hypothetical protein